MSIFGKAFNKITGGSTESVKPSVKSEELPQKSAKTPEKPSLARPESAKTATSSQGGSAGKSLPMNDPLLKSKNDDFNKMVEEDARLSNEVAEEIGMKILNSRKVNVKDDEVPGSKAVSKNTLKN